MLPTPFNNKHLLSFDKKYILKGNFEFSMVALPNKKRLWEIILFVRVGKFSVAAVQLVV